MYKQNILNNKNRKDEPASKPYCYNFTYNILWDTNKAI
jgi:hypothetical protein